MVMVWGVGEPSVHVDIIRLHCSLFCCVVADGDNDNDVDNDDIN